MTAKFNPLFNGEVAFDQGYNTLVNGHVNRYDELLAVYPWGTEEQAQAVVPQMDRAIEKAIKVIQKHSMSIGGEQKNPYVIDAYMLLAKASFFKQEYFKALEGFNYVIQKFPRTEQALEAQIWAGRTNARIGNELAAQYNYEEVYKNRDLKDRLVPHVSASLAELEIQRKNWTGAIEFLKEAIEADPKKEDRIRWTYILGQLYARTGLRHEASQAFGRVVRDHPANYEFYINARLERALNFDVFMGDVNEVYDDLEDLADDEKNLEYKDRIYYVMALLALVDEDYPKAEESLKRSLRASQNNPGQMGLSYVKLAEINFEFRQYVPAQAYYDSAYQTLPSSHAKYAEVERFRGSLNNLVAQINTIETNDSLIRLSQLSPSRQRQIFEDYIANLKEREAREAEIRQNREMNRALAAQSEALGGGPQAGLGGGWYFYNSTTRSSGVRDFQALWGRRELSDNWRRSAAAFAAAGNAEEESGASEEDGGSEVAGPSGEQRYNIDAYLAQIPKDSATIAGMHLENQDAYIRMARIYKEDIRDPNEAIKTYQKYLERYPNGADAPLATYALHILFKEIGDEQRSEGYASQLRSQFPSSRYAQQLDGALEAESDLLVDARKDYKAAYELFLAGQSKSAKTAVEAGLSKYEQTAMAAKYQLLLALTLVSTEGEEAYSTQLNYVVDNYPNTLEAEKARELLLYVSGGPVEEESIYAHQPSIPHRVLIILPNGSGDMSALRNEISNFNTQFNRFQNLQFQNIFLDRDRQLIVVSGFTDFASAFQYSDRLPKNPAVATVLPTENMRIFAISDANYQTFYREKDVDEYMTFYEKIGE